MEFGTGEENFIRIFTYTYVNKNVDICIYVFLSICLPEDCETGNSQFLPSTCFSLSLFYRYLYIYRYIFTYLQTSILYLYPVLIYMYIYKYINMYL